MPEKIFQILVMLLEADGDVVAKESFFNRLWPGDTNGDANLTQHVFMLRGFLGEHARDHAYVVTVPGRGYRLASPIESKVGLLMKGSCEGCGRTLLPDGEAFICSYECTFCAECSSAQRGRCPNCGGEQVVRPRRAVNPAATSSDSSDTRVQAALR